MKWYVNTGGWAILAATVLAYFAIPESGETLSRNMASAVYGGDTAVPDAQCESRTTCDGIGNSCAQNIFPDLCNTGAQVDIYAGNRNTCVWKEEYSDMECQYGSPYLCKQKKACIWQNGSCVINLAAGTIDTNFPSSCTNL